MHLSLKSVTAPPHHVLEWVHQKLRLLDPFLVHYNHALKNIHTHTQTQYIHAHTCKKLLLLPLVFRCCFNCCCSLSASTFCSHMAVVEEAAWPLMSSSSWSVCMYVCTQTPCYSQCNACCQRIQSNEQRRAQNDACRILVAHTSRVQAGLRTRM